MKSKSSSPAIVPRLNMKRIDAFLKYYKKMQKTQKTGMIIGALSLLAVPFALATMTRTTEDRSKAAPPPACKIIGCNHQYCVPLHSQDIAPTCASPTPDKCTALTTCELQPSGECGWTDTTEYTQCLESTSRQIQKK